MRPILSFMFIFSVVLLGWQQSSHSTPQDLDYLDPQFETPWQGSEYAEEKTIREVGKVIGDYVRRHAEIIQKWREEYDKYVELSKTCHNDLYRPLFDETMEEKYGPKALDRYSALGLIFNNLPQRKNFSATRDVHRKSHGCYAARVTINNDIPQSLQKGLFQPGKTYDAIVRFSNGNPKNVHDFTPDARGMAVKFLPWGTLPESENQAPSSKKYFIDGLGNSINPVAINQATLLDMLAINFPVFFVNDPKKYVDINTAFLTTSDDPTAWLTHKWGEFSAVYLQGLTAWEKELALNVNGSLILNPLHEEYWSMAAYRLGDYEDSNRTPLKFKFTPCSQNLPKEGVPSWTKEHVYAFPTESWNQYILSDQIDKLQRSGWNFLRKEAHDQLTNIELPTSCFKLEVQPYLDPVSTPIEDTTDIWLESKPQQLAWSEKFAHPRYASWFEANDLAHQRRARMIIKSISAPITIGLIELYKINYPYFVDEYGLDRNLSGAMKDQIERCEDLSFNPWNNVSS